MPLTSTCVNIPLTGHQVKAVRTREDAIGVGQQLRGRTIFRGAPAVHDKHRVRINYGVQPVRDADQRAVHKLVAHLRALVTSSFAMKRVEFGSQQVSWASAALPTHQCVGQSLPGTHAALHGCILTS